MLDLDIQLFLFINRSLSNDFLDALLPVLTDLQKTMPFKILAPLFIVFFFYRKYQKAFWKYFVALLLTLGTADFFSNKLLKRSIQRLRPADAMAGVPLDCFKKSTLENPDHPLDCDLSDPQRPIVRAPYGSFSFPSNHSVNMFCLAGFLLFTIQPLGVLSLMFAFIVAFSRVYVGVHYPSDVIGGAIIGFLWSLMAVKILQKILSREKNNGV